MKRKRLPIDIKKIEKHYRIEEDGAVFSLTKGRYLKPTPNSANYLMVYLHLYLPHWFTIHRLVYFKYVGVCPDHLEVGHVDGNKWNCHFSNLEAVSHGRNCLDSYRLHNRKAPIGNTHPPSIETKRLMALRKNKPVVSSDGVEYISIAEAAKVLGISRKTVERSIGSGGMVKRSGVSFRFADKNC